MSLILLICPVFYNYEESIKKSLESKGYIVHTIFYDEGKVFHLPVTTRILLKLINIFFSKFKFLRMYRHKTLHSAAELFFDEQISLLRDKKFDKVLVVKGFGLNATHLNKINVKERFLYQWDLIDNYPLVKKIYPGFDRVFTFDIVDSNRGFGTYLPNFYVRRGYVNKDKKYDLFFIGAYTKDRYRLLQEVIRKAQSMNLSYYFKLVNQGLLSRLIINFDKYDLVTNKVYQRKEYQEYFDSSKAIFEISHTGQAGATQRLLEGLEQGKVMFVSSRAPFKSETVFTVKDFLKCNESELIDIINNDNYYSNEPVIAEYEIDTWINKIIN